MKHHDGSAVEIPLPQSPSENDIAGRSSLKKLNTLQSQENPILVHREFHDETNMRRIQTTQAYKTVNNVRVGKTQEVEKESKIPLRVPIDRQATLRAPLDNHGRMCKLSAVGSTLSQETIDMYMQQEKSQRNLGLSPQGRMLNYRLPWKGGK